MSRFALIALFGLALVAAQSAAADPAPASLNPADAPAGTYLLDKSHASVVAKVSHLGLSSYAMRFDGLDAHYDYDPAEPLATKVMVTIDANSLDVGDPKIGAQFAQQFLGADQHPQITFVSTAIQPTTGDQGVMTGDLTLNGVTKPVSLAVTFNGCGPGPFGFGGYRMGFSATGDIKRSDFDSRAWLSMVGDDIHLVIEAEFTRK